MSVRKIKITWLLRPYWRQLAVAFVAIMAESATDLLEPWPLKVVFDYVFGGKPMTGWLARLVGGTVGTSRLAVLNFAALAVILINVLTLLGMLGVMFYLDWRFTLISLAVAPALFVLVYSYTRRIKHNARQVKKKEGEIASVVQESFSAMRLIKAFAREDFESRRLDKKSRESVEMALLARSVKAKLTPLVELTVALGTCLVLWYGARLVLAEQISAGALIVFILYLSKMYKPMRDLSKMTDTVSKAQVGFERIREVLATESQVRDLPGARRAPPLRGRVQFEHVSFAYNREQPVLKDINLVVEPGEFVALVGPTGSGKSTLISLIPRFYDPTEGRVGIDGIR